MAQSRFTHRLAQREDIPAIAALMQAAITENMKAFLSPTQIEAAATSMGVDRTLIEDQTYFLIEAPSTEADPQGVATRVLVGCGGWGKRKTLYGGDSTAGRDDALSDPEHDAARIRAMYTHPDWTRQGIGSLLLDLGEAAARRAGFRSIALGSTVPGEPLYLARGYVETERTAIPTDNGEESVVITMVKTL